MVEIVDINDQNKKSEKSVKRKKKKKKNRETTPSENLTVELDTDREVVQDVDEALEKMGGFGCYQIKA